jgi:hypothetical protein
MRLRKSWSDQLLGLAIAWVIKAIIPTLRLEIQDPHNLRMRGPGETLIWLAWHNRIFIVPHLFQKHFPTRPGSAMTSASRDGGLLAVVLRQFRVGAVRGSSSKKGAAALREAVKLMRRGSDICITPDGPRGPRYHLAPGVVLLAQMAKAPVMPVHVEYSNAWKLRTWDQLRLPKPFSRVIVTLGEPLTVPPARDPEAIEAQRLRLQQILRATLHPHDPPARPEDRKK